MQRTVACPQSRRDAKLQSPPSSTDRRTGSCQTRNRISHRDRAPPPEQPCICHDDKKGSETKKNSLLTCPWQHKRDILSFGQGLISQDRLVSIYSSAAPVDSLLVSEVDQIWIGAPLPNRATLIVVNALTIAAIDLYVWRARAAATATYEEEGINAIPFVVQAGRSDRSRSC
jgi:hypothetical protein